MSGATIHRVIAQLAPGIQLVVTQISRGHIAEVHVGEWPEGTTVSCNTCPAGRFRVDIEPHPVLWLDNTCYDLPRLELLKVADFLQIDIPLPHPPEGTAVQS